MDLTRSALAASLLVIVTSASTGCGYGDVTGPTTTAPSKYTPAALLDKIQSVAKVSVSAEGRISKAPDIAYLRTGVKTLGVTAAEAIAANRSAMNSIFLALETASIPDADLQTSHFLLQPDYDYNNRRPGEAPRLVGYTSSNELTVTVRNLSQLGTIIDTLINAGSQSFSGITFALDDDNPARNEARKQAVEAASAQAALYADATGHRVGSLLSLSEVKNYVSAPKMTAGRFAAAQVDATRVAEGELTFYASVDAVFELIPK